MGLVLTIQSRPVLVDFGAVSMLPGMVALSVIREMGPVITALICAGKIGSGMGAELGSMKVTEQIDAMEVSSTNPIRFLVVTRVLAATLMIPLLVLYADALGILGSWGGANIKGSVTFTLFFSQAFRVVDFMDLIPAIIKTFFFGAVIGFVGCYMGYTAGRGTESVGKAANSAVVLSSLLVIIVDLIAVQITDMLYLSLQLFEGENLVVLGKSGSGKSVLIKCIVRLLNPDMGTITVLGENISEMRRKELATLREKVGFLFQSGALYDSMTIKENLEFPLKRIRKNLTRKEMDEKINEVLENVGLADTLNKMPSELSGGMRKRASLARTIVVDPMIMLYDEPTTGLDPVTSDEISWLINDVQEKYKTSSIIITHDIECARATADRVIMLKDGEVYLEGDIDDFEKSADPLIRSFFKKQKKNERK
ncbi:MAG: ABC transporter permease [Draconibacterium sp.]|nr:ABC transporter permease [Draconibacterium sp.]